MVFVGYDISMICFEFHLVTCFGLSLREACIISILAQSKCDEATVIARSVHPQNCHCEERVLLFPYCYHLRRSNLIFGSRIQKKHRTRHLYWGLLRFARNDSLVIEPPPRNDSSGTNSHQSIPLSPEYALSTMHQITPIRSLETFPNTQLPPWDAMHRLPALASQ